MKKMILTQRRNKIYKMLCSGKVSVADITIRTGYSDPRSYIRDLRASGINVRDEWRKATDGIRYKVYFIEQ